ncbi:hypothetical protein GRI97_12450 [Altererythrobacter xixiisoli]|uniref:Uncharacterized protein n=1 Tax=Croceibacterium xixiisoli TaxID=1476466 RepID=A0A6I4TYE4_9SPHN|nr:hypothetical protein [Croceibacterium xixiisoli]MXO99797.1 hypothetical protein [Croceibacterium xixiisoli]
MARIETAAERVEAALAARVLVKAQDLQLQQNYEALRAEAHAALTDLDRLIGSIER